MFFRVTYNNIGIYEALKQNVSLDIWRSLLNSNIFNWLPKPPEYLFGYKSYFTKFGFDKFYQIVLPICKKYLEQNLIKIEVFEFLNKNIIYQDDYQIIINDKYPIFESKFEQLYLKIINEYTGNNYPKLTNTLKKIYPVQHEYLDRYKIINEISKSKKLVPVPEELINIICENIIKVKQNIYKISYKEILKLVQSSTYIEADQFRQNLIKYIKDLNGYLYILFVIPDNSNNILKNTTFTYLQTMIQSDEKACDFYNEILKFPNTVKGITIIKHYFEIENYKDSLIYINKNQISEYFDFSDILDHELIHFIQRITGFGEDITNIIIRNYSMGLSNIEINIINKFCDTDKEKQLLENLIYDKFKKNEIIETKKDIINFFKRQYILKGNNENKLIWLNKFLQSINNYSLFNKYNLFNKLKIYLNSSKEKETFEIALTLICFCYLIFKNEYIEYNIDDILKEEFENF